MVQADEFNYDLSLILCATSRLCGDNCRDSWLLKGIAAGKGAY